MMGGETYRLLCGFYGLTTTITYHEYLTVQRVAPGRFRIGSDGSIGKFLRLLPVAQVVVDTAQSAKQIGIIRGESEGLMQNRNRLLIPSQLAQCIGAVT